MIVSRRTLPAALGFFVAARARAQDAPDPLAGRFGGPFTLTAHDGRRVSDADFRGRFMLIYFGYTHCPDICPDDLLIEAKALALLGQNATRVQPLFVTVDPQRDTPELLREYLPSFDARILGLTGTEAEIAAVAKAYRVHRVKYTPANDPTSYGVDHSALTYLVGPDGAFRTLIPHGVTAERMAAIIAPYLGRE